jgi:hypothetical protein
VTVLERREQATAWELRGRWAKCEWVVLTLSDRCMVRRLEGVVEHVAVTGAYVVVDGWHVPTVDVLGVARPHHTQGAAA